MAFSEKLLNENETIAADLRPHPWYFFRSVVALIGAILLGILVLSFTDSGEWTRTWAGWFALIVIVACAGWVVSTYIGWISTNFVITSDRVIYRSGVIRKTGVEIPLERVNTVHFTQHIFERMIGTGDLIIESGATEGMQRFTDIRDPDSVQRLIHHQTELKAQRRQTTLTPAAPDSDFAPPAPQSAATDVATQLEKLEGMLERGTLTPDEFAAQKQRLLGQ